MGRGGVGVGGLGGGVGGEGGEKKGAGIGIGQIPGQVGAKRPSVKLPIEGLFCVGACAGGAGVGTELAINSALEFFDSYSLFIPSLIQIPFV